MAARKIFSDSYLEAQQNLKTLFLRSDTHLNTKKGISAKIAEILNSGIIKLAQFISKFISEIIPYSLLAFELQSDDYEVNSPYKISTFYAKGL